MTEVEVFGPPWNQVRRATGDKKITKVSAFDMADMLIADMNPPVWMDRTEGTLWCGDKNLSSLDFELVYVDFEHLGWGLSMSAAMQAVRIAAWHNTHLGVDAPWRALIRQREAAS